MERGAGAAIAPSQPLPHVQPHSPATSITPPRGTPKALPLYVTGTLRQKKMAQMKEQIKAPEKNTTKQRRDSQPIRCTVQTTGYQDAHRIG